MKRIIKNFCFLMSAIMALSTIESRMILATEAGMIKGTGEYVNEGYVQNIIPENQYSLKLKKISEKKIKITLRNKGTEDIKNLQIDMITDATLENTSLGNAKKDYDYVTIETTYTLHKGYSKEIVLEFANEISDSDIERISICGDKVFEDGKYDNICFTSVANYDFTSETVMNKEKVLLLDDTKQNEVKVKINKVTGNDEYNYKGNVYTIINGDMTKVDVMGDMFVSEEGILGTLVGETETKLPISFTINYTSSNENPYLFLAIGDVTIGEDLYFVYGNRKEENDELSDEKIKEEGNNLEEAESIGECGEAANSCDSMVLTNDDLHIDDESYTDDNTTVKTSSEAAKDYDTTFQKMSWKGYNYKGAFYPLISTCLYSPSKQKANCRYYLRGKVNEQMANADYYITKVCVNPGSVLSHSSTAKMTLYTKDGNAQMSELDPETTGKFTFSASIPVPYLNAAFGYFKISFPSISAKKYKINSSDLYNKAEWKFNDYISCSFSTNASSSKYPTKIKKAYSGQCNVVYHKNKKTSYTLYCDGYVYYKGTIGLGHYRTDYSFNCSVGCSKKISIVPNT